jgi:hypothetical protein
VSATAALVHGRHPWFLPRITLTGPARALLVAGIAWGAFAFGAVYPWAYWPLAIAAAAVALVGLAAPAAIGWRTLDLTAVTLALAIFLVAAAAQLVPLPAATVHTISPETPSIVAQLDLTAQLDPASARPLTIDPARTRRGLVVVASLAALIVGARGSSRSSAQPGRHRRSSCSACCRVHGHRSAAAVHRENLRLLDAVTGRQSVRSLRQQESFCRLDVDGDSRGDRADPQRGLAWSAWGSAGVA